MPRKAREKSKTGIYHVMQRGINRQTIFHDEEDYQKYLDILQLCQQESGFSLYAYCLMGNHTHLLLQEKKEPLEQIFKRLGSRYVYWYNWKYQRSGPLFQDRFKSEAVEDDGYFLTVIRYIYQNPIKAGLCGELSEYPWSSYRLLGQETGLMDHQQIFGLMSYKQFLDYVAEENADHPLELSAKPRMSDAMAMELFQEISGLADISQLPLLEPAQQSEYVQILHSHGISIRHLVRLTGISKKIIESRLKS